jgi:hypothetical protein
MCRSIKVLRKPDQATTSEEVQAAALQFVRKISGYHHPSLANQEVFNVAVAEIAGASQRLLGSLTKPAGRRGPKRAASQGSAGILPAVAQASRPSDD